MMCARISVSRESWTFIERNSSISPIAVTISGFITGRLLTSSTRVRTTRLAFDRPMAAMVPTTVDTTVAITATSTV